MHADAWLCDSLRGRLHKYKRTAMRFVAAPLAHMQMCVCALRLWLHAHVHGCALRLWALAHAHMRSCALRLGVACTYADVRLCDSSRHRSYICRCTAVRFALECTHMCRCTAARFVAEPLAHMQMRGCALRLGVPAHVQMHGYALRRWIARSYAYAWLCASTRNRSYICIRTAARSIAWRPHGRWRAHKNSTFR